MNWISVKDRLPVIPEGKYGISVLVAEYDEMFAEFCNSREAGYTVREKLYATTKDLSGAYTHPYWEKNKIDYDFMELNDYGNGLEWMPVDDEITHWMYLPEPPKQVSKKCEGCEAIGYCS